MDDRVQLAHGGGGFLARRLVEELFLPLFRDESLARMEDCTPFSPPPGRLAMTTDSFVVDPLFFPGGDIGKLAVCGTVNDLAAGGADPAWMSVGFILEEGFPMEDLRRVAESMRDAAREAGVRIIAGDTKVVPRGKADKVFISAAGVGVLPDGPSPSPGRISPGDAVLVSGFVGDHGLAVLAAREGLSLPVGIRSDCAPLSGMLAPLRRGGLVVHAMRDPTRGGVAAVLNEMAESAGVEIMVCEADIPVREEVASACEMLGFDPLSLANEGKMVVVLPEPQAAEALELMRSHAYGRSSRQIGRVFPCRSPRVTVMTSSGGVRRLHMPAGEILPRIC